MTGARGPDLGLARLKVRSQAHSHSTRSLIVVFDTETNFLVSIDLSSNEHSRRFMATCRSFGALQTGLRYDQARPNVPVRPPLQCLKGCFDLPIAETAEFNTTWAEASLQVSMAGERAERSVDIMPTLWKGQQRPAGSTDLFKKLSYAFDSRTVYDRYMITDCCVRNDLR